MKIMLFDESEITFKRLQKLISKGTDEDDFLVPINDFNNILMETHRNCPDVIILNTYFLGGSTLETIRILHTICPKVKIIALTELNEPAYLKLLDEAGSDYCLDISNEFQHIPEILTEIKNNHQEINTSIHYN